MRMYKYQTVRVPNVGSLFELKSKLEEDSYARVSQGRCVEVALAAVNMAMDDGSIDSETIKEIAQGRVLRLESNF